MKKSKKEDLNQLINQQLILAKQQLIRAKQIREATEKMLNEQAMEIFEFRKKLEDIESRTWRKSLRQYVNRRECLVTITKKWKPFKVSWTAVN